jgi:hypothetical protein
MHAGPCFLSLAAFIDYNESYSHIHKHPCLLVLFTSPFDSAFSYRSFSDRSSVDEWLRWRNPILRPECQFLIVLTYGFYEFDTYMEAKVL